MIEHKRNRSDSWTEEEDNLLKENHNKYSVADLPSILGRSHAAIRHRIKKLKLRRPNNARFINGRVCSVDINFFKTPNIINSYWAGYIAADGCIDNGRLIVCCGKSDIEILTNFQKDIKSNYKLQYTPPKIKIIKGKRVKSNGSYKISLSSSRISNDLLKYWNITERKSLTLEPPNITNQLHKYAYIRGFFDGDGYITYSPNSKRRRPGFIMGFTSGQSKILIWIREQLKILCPNLSWKDKIYGKNTNLHIKFCRKKGREIHKALKEIINVPQLSRKWDIEYFKG